VIGFYTKFTTEESNRGMLVDILSEAALSMQAFKECHMYIVNKDASDVTATWVTEIWTSMEAHGTSLQMDSAKTLIAKAMPLITAKPEQIKLLPVSGKGL
jgi:quinol monooxygenase YgiN